MKTWIIITLIGAYFALGILVVSLICKIINSNIDLGDETDVIVTGFYIIFWPLFLIAVIGILAALELCEFSFESDF